MLVLFCSQLSLSVVSAARANASMEGVEAARWELGATGASTHPHSYSCEDISCNTVVLFICSVESVAMGRYIFPKLHMFWNENSGG